MYSDLYQIFNRFLNRGSGIIINTKVEATDQSEMPFLAPLINLWIGMWIMCNNINSCLMLIAPLVKITKKTFRIVGERYLNFLLKKFTISLVYHVLLFGSVLTWIILSPHLDSDRRTFIIFTDPLSLLMWVTVAPSQSPENPHWI